MRHTTRMQAGWVVLGAAMALAGCNCNKPVDECGTPSVVFLAPADGDAVGLKIDVSVRGLDSSGAAMDLDSAKLEVQQPGEAAFGHLTQGDLSGAQATFPQVALGAGDNQLKATVVKKGSSTCTATKTITVTAKDTALPPKVTQVTFPQDQNADGVLNGAELPRGTKMLVKVKVANGSGVRAQVKRGTTVVGSPVDVAAGEATVTLDLLPEEDTANDDFFAELLKGGVAQNTPGSNPEASASIRVNRVAPSCSNTTRAVMGPAQDADPVLAGFQLRGTGTVGATVASAVFLIAGVGQSAPSTPAAGAVSGDITVAAAGDTTYSVVLVASDADGNTCRDAKMVQVDLVPPVVTISSPVGVDGGNARVSTSPLAVDVVVSGVNDGTQVCATRQQGSGAPVQVDCAPVSGGLAILNVPFAASGTYTITVSATDAAGNTGSTSVTVDATLSGCPVVFTKPGQCPGLVLARDLFIGRYTAEIQSTGCAGHNARIYLDGGTPICSQAIGSNEKVQCNVPLTGGTYTLSAQVDNTVGPPSSVSCNVTVDTSTPALIFPNGVSAAAPSVINMSQDTQPSVAGAQAYLNFMANVPSGGHVDVCINQPLAPASGTCADGAAGWYQLATNVTVPTYGFTYPEGEYQVKVVVVQSGMTNVSAPAFVRVDVTPPCVSAAGLSFPQDLNADSMLNAAELDGGAPRLTFAQGSGCLDPANAPSPGVQVRSVSGSTVQPTVYNLAADVSYGPSNGPISVNLSQNVAAEADYVFFVQLSDWVGNTNAYSAGTSAARAVRVDRVAPGCTISAPAKASPLNMADVPSGSLAATVTTSSDATPVVMKMTSGATTLTQTGSQPASPGFTSSATFALTGDSTWNLAAACSDRAGNTSSAANSWRVDLVPPTCSVAKPAPGNYTALPVTANVAASGQTGNVRLSSSVSGVLAPIAAGTDVGLNLANGTHTLTATVTDDTGNTGTCSVSNVVVNTTNCDLTVSNLFQGAGVSWVNTTNSTPTAGGASVTLQVASTLCPNAPVTVTKGTTVVQSGTTNASGTVSLAMTVADGDSYTVTIANTAALTTARTVGVDLTPPTFSGVTLNGAASTGTPMFLVAPADNPKAGATGYYADLDATTANGQLNFAATITSSLPGSPTTGAGTIDVLYGGTPLVAAIPVSAVPYSLALTPLTFVHNTTGTFLVRVTDQAGNVVVVFTSAMTVDVIAPGAVTTSIAAPTSVRTATVAVGWTASYDDGMVAASGPVTNYDLRWTTSSMPGHNNLTVAADWSSSALVKEALQPAGTLTKTINPPPLNTYYAAARAVDKVGNYSPFVAGASRVNMWTPVTLTAPVANSKFGLAMSGGTSLNNDAIPDLVVAAPARGSGSVGSVYIYYGVSGFSSQTTCSAPACQELTPYDGQAGLFGIDLSTAGNVGDLAGENKPDLVLVQDAWNGWVGRAFIYFGTSTAATIDAANFIEIRGDSAFVQGNPWQAARIIPDLNGDGLAEFAISVWNGGPGAVYIFKGRSVAAWQAARTATDAVTSRKYIPINAADWVIKGPSGYVDPNNSQFGMSAGGLVGLGDTTADGGVPTLGVPMSLPTINKYQTYAASAIVASTFAAPLGFASATSTLTQAVATGTDPLRGFGANALGRRNFINAAQPDLVLSNASANAVLIYADVSAAGLPGATPSFTVTGPAFFGGSLAGGDLDGDGFLDLLVGQSVAASPTPFALYQRANAYDTPVGGSNQKVWVSKFAGGASSDLGLTSVLVDVDGDGLIDVVLGDEINSVVQIYR